MMSENLDSLDPRTQTLDPEYLGTPNPTPYTLDPRP